MSKKSVPTINIQPDSQTDLSKRRQSSDGRFTIIDEQSKDSDSFDETSSDNDSTDQFVFSKSCYISKCSSPNLPHLNYSISQPSKMSSLGTNTSRFQVVPVEGRYQRNRWLAWDYFSPGHHSSPQTPTISSKQPMFHLTPPPSKKSAQKSNSYRTAPLATPEPMSSVNFDFSDESDQENSIPSSPFEKHQITVKRANGNPLQNGHKLSDITELRDGLQNPVPKNLSPTPSGILPLMNGKISSTEMLNLERSLSSTTSYSSPRNTTTTSQIRSSTLSPDRALHPNENSTGVVTTAHVPHSATNVQVAHPHASILAIDSKIEQAMDLVKSHLLFAVREEIDHLRSRIMELETTVVHLETENSMLREHVPNDILQNLAGQPASNKTAMT